MAKEWVVCPAQSGETTVFQSFLNVIKIIEKTGHRGNSLLVFQANYSVTKETHLAMKISFIKSHFEGAACTEVRIFRIQKLRLVCLSLSFLSFLLFPTKNLS